MKINKTARGAIFKEKGRYFDKPHIDIPEFEKLPGNDNIRTPGVSWLRTLGVYLSTIITDQFLLRDLP